MPDPCLNDIVPGHYNDVVVLIIYIEKFIGGVNMLNMGIEFALFRMFRNLLGFASPGIKPPTY